MSYLLNQLADGFRLTGAAFAAYFGSAILVAIAVIPASLRTVQLFTRDDNGWLEIVVELLRVVLVVAMIIVGRKWSVRDVFGGARWAEVGRDVAHAWRGGWTAILLQLTVLTALILVFNVGFESVMTTDNVATFLTALDLNPVHAGRTNDAVIFAVKNIVVIPVYLVAMLRALDIFCDKEDPIPVG
ncbi:hypothetical protein [Microbacterium sp. zg-YB36]|uniref:hypothetical protein n=1 Tax=Microbacterium sp. zg-YB36 TaxID=2969407 RepID=UPI00214CAB5E|nr:hypothetical protein [Microbacterium sp. zg-YB36]MDL5352441.1 hypothetical protein [Microbacterium sp. zg-YB36]